MNASILKQKWLNTIQRFLLQDANLKSKAYLCHALAIGKGSGWRTVTEIQNSNTTTTVIHVLMAMTVTILILEHCFKSSDCENIKVVGAKISASVCVHSGDAE